MLFKRYATPQTTIMYGKMYGKIRQISIHPLLEEAMTKYGLMDRVKKKSDEKNLEEKLTYGKIWKKKIPVWLI